jgi:hypothetical protein
MTRTQLAYEVGDVSTAAKSLRAQLQKLERLPSHVELLNMLARAAGFRNFQHFRADVLARTPSVPPDGLNIDLARIERAARHFDPEGRLLRWPARESHAILCLWVLWSRLPGGESFNEIEISELLDGWHSFDDRALLRRALVDYGLVNRTIDGRKYVRVSQKPPAELGLLLKLVGAT